MIRSLFLLIYTLFYFFALLILLPFEYFKRPRDLRRRWLIERCGLMPKGPTSSNPRIWIHSVSVGEVIASVLFIQEILRSFPSCEIVLTTVTDTGQKIARERLQGSVRLFYLPFDIPFFIWRFIKAIKPFLYISIETELWPNLFCILKRQGIPILIMNGRISDRSFNGYRKIRYFMKTILDYVDLFCMQEELYGERIRQLGASTERIRITGNFKFDTRISDYRGDWIRYLKGPTILAGSTHEGEEDIILDSFERLKGEIRDITLIIAPRHPERFSEVEGILNRRKINYLKRSEMCSPDSTEKLSSFRVILIDVIGELASLYSICDIAIIGGSFLGKGGHNPLEPAFWGKPILCGGDMGNFPFIDEFYKREAAIKTSEKDLYHDIRMLLLSEDKRSRMGKEAKAIYEERAGAIKRSIEILKGYLKFP